jgi:hypothetical protein
MHSKVHWKCCKMWMVLLHICLACRGRRESQTYPTHSQPVRSCAFLQVTSWCIWLLLAWCLGHTRYQQRKGQSVLPTARREKVSCRGTVATLWTCVGQALMQDGEKSTISHLLLTNDTSPDTTNYGEAGSFLSVKHRWDALFSCKQ